MSNIKFGLCNYYIVLVDKVGTYFSQIMLYSQVYRFFLETDKDNMGSMYIAWFI